MGKEAPEGQLHLPPGFRFYPTDEELVVQYLSRQASSQPFAASIIAEVDLYKFDPWELPEKALFGEKEWYFFSPRDRKYPNGSRPNRAAGSGYWKATGTDKPIISGGSHKVGVKKALVFYIGKAPRGTKTNWIMHEYRLADGNGRAVKKKGSLRLDDWVLCRIYKKSSSAQKGARKAYSGQLEDVLASLPDIDDHRLSNLPQINSLRPLMDEKPSLILEKNYQTADNISSCAWKKSAAPSDTGFYHLEQYYNAPTDETDNGVATAADSSRCYAIDGRSNAHTNLGGLPPLLHIEYHAGKPRRPIHDCPDEEVESTFRLHQNDNMFVQSSAQQPSELINFNDHANRPPPVLSQQQLDPVVTSVFDSAFLASLGVYYPHRPE